MSPEIIGKKEGEDTSGGPKQQSVEDLYGQYPPNVEDEPQGCHIADVSYKIVAGKGIKGHLTPPQRDTENG